MMVNKKKRKGGLYVIVAFLVYTFLIAHVDCNTITTWGYDLLDSIRLGHLSEFPVYTYQMHDMATNYNLFVNLITAVWLSPVYIIDNLCNAHAIMLVYDVWYKCLILLMTSWSVKLLGQILEKIQIPRERIYEGQLYYSFSAILLISVLGKGQVDIISLCFLMFGIRNMLDKKYTLMALCYGLSLCVKPFSILIIVPILILLISKHEWKIVAYGFITLVPYMLDAIITRLCMPRYGEMKAITSWQFKEAFGTSRVEQLFMADYNNILIYWAIVLFVCLLCLKLAVTKRVKRVHYVILPAIIYILFAFFVSATAYWFVLLLPWLIIMGLEISDRNDFRVLYFITNIGLVIYTIMLERKLMPGANYSLLQLVGIVGGSDVSIEPFAQWQIYGYKVGATMFVVGMLILWLTYILEWKRGLLVENKEIIDFKTRKSFTILCKILLPMPVILYFLATYAIKFFYRG